MLREASTLEIIQIASSTTYTYQSPFINLTVYNKPVMKIADAIGFCINKVGNRTNNELFYKQKGDSDYLWRMDDEELFQYFAILIMTEMIPAYAKSILYLSEAGEQSHFAEPENIQKFIQNKTQELQKAFLDGMYAYNLSVSSEPDNLTDEKTSSC